MISASLARRGFRYIVISDDRREVERLRRDGVSALFGDAANPGLLEAAHAATARVVIVAVADPHASRLIAERARALAPRVPLVVRSHGRSQRSLGRPHEPGIQVIRADVELAVQMVRFTMRRFGVSAAEAEAIATGLRSAPVAGRATPSTARANPAGPARVRAWVAGRLEAGRERLQRTRAGGEARREPRDKRVPAVEAPER
jgi:CPA2 family monovalent cation:H+ antiporter-2